MGRLDGKVALVTGAARGVGAEVARLFVREGAQVLLADVRDEPGEAVASSLGAAAAYQRLDVRDEAAWAAAVAAAGDHYGPVDVLVNNAAILLAFLASDESSFCSGGDFAVDGAFTAGHIIPGAPGSY